MMLEKEETHIIIYTYYYLRIYEENTHYMKNQRRTSPTQHTTHTHTIPSLKKRHTHMINPLTHLNRILSPPIVHSFKSRLVVRILKILKIFLSSSREKTFTKSEKKSHSKHSKSDKISYFLCVRFLNQKRKKKDMNFFSLANALILSSLLISWAKSVRPQHI